MENFTMYNPVKLRFGEGVLEQLPKTLAQFGKKVLLIYGKNSIKTSGLYDLIHELLHDFEIIEYGGIKPNPLVEDADEAAHLGREAKVDVILAVGGGSVIDTAKMVAIGIPASPGIWDFMIGKKKPQSAIPLVAVLTLAATGTEMNMFAVLQNQKTQQKFGYGHPLIYPAESFLDPVLTYSVPADYTAYGIADLIAHCLEGYFGKGEATLSDKIVFGIIKDSIEFAEPLLDNPTDYELRARMMYAATLALNGITNYGREYGDWGVHSLGHPLSLLFDMAHGASLSIVYPSWMRLFKKEISDRLELLGKEVFGVETADECIDAFENFFRQIGTPVNLTDIELSENEKQHLLEHYEKHKPNGRAHILQEADFKKLVDLMN